jgi:hypothetical protein
MITVKVGNEERELSQVDQHWLCKQIEGRRSDHQTDCVTIRINTGDLNMTLVTPGCASDVGGGRAPNPHEQEVFDLWNKLHLDKPGFSCGNVEAFLKQLRRMI